MAHVPEQLDLLGWTPPQPVRRFEAKSLRARNIAAMASRAVATALRETDVPREVIARRMSEYLGQPVSRNVLDGYASQAREDQTVSLPRFIALLHATGDRRLLQAVADLFGWAVIENRYLPMIELAAVQQQRETLRRRAGVLARQASGGALRA